MTKAENELIFNDIRNTLTEASKYEQMAEECVELAHACMKKARKLRDENYTPRKMYTIDDDISEEFTDVAICAEMLQLKPDEQLFEEKLKRFQHRIHIGRQKPEVIFDENHNC